MIPRQAPTPLRIALVAMSGVLGLGSLAARVLRRNTHLR